MSHYIPDEDMYWTYVNTPQDILGTEEFMLRCERAVHRDFEQQLETEDFDVVLKEADGSGLPSGYWPPVQGLHSTVPKLGSCMNKIR